MAITEAIVTGLTPTTTGTVSYTVSGFGTPQAAIIIVSDTTSASNTASNAGFGIGWTDGTAGASLHAQHEDNQATSDCYRYGNSTTAPIRVITRINVSGVAAIVGDFSAWTTDGITIDFTTVAAAQFNITIKLIKGCTTIKAGSTAMTGTAAHTISSLSGKPNLVYFLANGGAAGVTIGANAVISLGAAHNNSSNTVSQGQIAFGSADGAADDLSNTVTRNDSCAGQLVNDSQGWKASASNFTSTGFDLTADVSPAGDTVFWLAMDTGDTDGVHVGIVDSPTATGTWAVTAPGFTPQSVLIGATTTATTNTLLSADPIGFGVGMFTSSAQSFIGIDCDEAAATMDTQSNFSSSKAVQLYHFGGTTHNIMHEGAFSSMDASGYSLSFPTYVDATTRRWLSVAIKAAVSSPTYTLTAAQGSYTLTGQASALTAARNLTAASGSYALTGYDATLTYTPVSGATYTLTAAQGSYGLTGNDAALTAARKLTADQGSYTLTGYDAALTYTHLPNYTLTAASGSYTLTGNDTALVASRVLTAEQGAYTYTGFSATLTSSADAQQSAVEQVAGGWWNSYNSEMQRREAAKAKKKKLKEELEKIEDKLDKEIILELSKKEKEKERLDELKRLSKLAQEHKREISQIMDDRIVMAVDRAITVGSYSAMEQMEREISKVKEEMEFLSMATEILINQYYLN